MFTGEKDDRKYIKVPESIVARFETSTESDLQHRHGGIILQDWMDAFMQNFHEVGFPTVMRQSLMLCRYTVN